MLTHFSMSVRARSVKTGLPHLWLMTDSERMTDPVAAAHRLPAGSAIILRHRAASERARLAMKLARICRARRLRLLIAGDWRLAAALRCDGVHLSEAAARRGPEPGLRLWRRRRLLTISFHGNGSWPAVACDATILGAILPTASHPGRTTLGTLKAARLARQRHVIALGGVNAATLKQLNGIRLAGVAGVGFVETI